MDERHDEHTPASAAQPAPVGVRLRRFGAAHILIFANVAVFAVMCLKGASPLEPTSAQGIAMGANNGQLIAQGQWWRLLAAAFVHFGVLHLLVNMIALNSLAIVEPLLGTPGFLYAYFTSALGASVSSVLWRPLGTSAGASGALFGLLGALLAFFLTHRRFIAPQVFGPMIRNILIMIGINVVFGLSVQFVDNAAHLGGLATGFLAGLCMYRAPVLVSENPRVIGWTPLPQKQIAGAALLVLAIVGGAIMIPQRVRTSREQDPSLRAQRGLVSYAARDWKRALSEFTFASSADDSGETQVYAWLARAHSGAREPATAELAKFVDGDGASDMDETWRRIALVLIGRESEADLVAWADHARDSTETRAGAWAAYFAAASLRELAGDKARAKELYARCVELSGGDSIRELQAGAALTALSR